MESLKLSVADGMETDQAVGAAEPDDVPALFATSAPAGPLPPQLAAVAALIDEESPAPRAAKRKRAMASKREARRYRPRAACLLVACLLACLLAGLLASWLACLLACWLACWLACLFACVFDCLHT